MENHTGLIADIFAVLGGTCGNAGLFEERAKDLTGEASRSLRERKALYLCFAGELSTDLFERARLGLMALRVAEDLDSEVFAMDNGMLSESMINNPSLLYRWAKLIIFSTGQFSDDASSWCVGLDELNRQKAPMTAKYRLMVAQRLDRVGKHREAIRVLSLVSGDNWSLLSDIVEAKSFLEKLRQKQATRCRLRELEAYASMSSKKLDEPSAEENLTKALMNGFYKPARECLVSNDLENGNRGMEIFAAACADLSLRVAESNAPLSMLLRHHTASAYGWLKRKDDQNAINRDLIRAIEAIKDWKSDLDLHFVYTKAVFGLIRNDPDFSANLSLSVWKAEVSRTYGEPDWAGRVIDYVKGCESRGYATGGTKEECVALLRRASCDEGNSKPVQCADAAKYLASLQAEKTVE